MLKVSHMPLPALISRKGDPARSPGLHALLLAPSALYRLSGLRYLERTDAGPVSGASYKQIVCKSTTIESQRPKASEKLEKCY